MQDQFRELLQKPTQHHQRPQTQRRPDENKRKSRIDLKDQKHKKVHTDEIFPLVSLTENPVVLVKQSEHYRFGNYKKYYNLRYERRWNDPRLSILGKDLFFDKKVLDIGCNDGTVTLIIAMRYHDNQMIRYFPIKIQGIDIDYQLINRAIENMTQLEAAYRKHHTSNPNPFKMQVEEKSDIQPIEQPPQSNTPQRHEQSETSQIETKTHEIMVKLSKLPKCFLMNIEDKACEKLDKLYVVENISTIVPLEKTPPQELVNKFPKNVYFRIENFISNTTRITDRYDTIMCLSTTKWIHLNWGDDGIKRLFRKVHESLYLGGHFILEPQDWKGYKKKRYFCEDFKKMYKQIKLRPEMFKDHLMATYNFKLIKEIKPDDVEAIKQGKSAFKRVIYIFQK